jgi:hypothetical protein
MIANTYPTSGRFEAMIIPSLETFIYITKLNELQ